MRDSEYCLSFIAETCQYGSEAFSSSKVCAMPHEWLALTFIYLCTIFRSVPVQALYDSIYWPFVVLVVCIALIIFQITVLRIHAFLALLVAAITAGLMSHVGVLDGEPLQSHWKQAVELSTTEFGKVCGLIGISIALASIIGECLMESGAADKVVRVFIRSAGPTRVGIALLASTYVLSVPIFFDTMFMLMVPLAKALHLRSKKDYLLYIMAICCGGVLTHSMTVPHPGPLQMVANLNIDIGQSIAAGFLVGIIPAIGGWFVCKWLNARQEIPLRETPGATLEELNYIAHRSEAELPGFWSSITPVILPVILISGASLFEVLRKAKVDPTQIKTVVAADPLSQFVEFIGNKNIALLIGAFISVLLLARQKKLSLEQVRDVIGPPLETAGIMILITAAGGAFGLMLQKAKVSDAIQLVCEGRAVNFILLGWFVALVIRIAQGSATVAMLTTSAMMSQMIAVPGALSFHKIYIYLAIGFGAIGCSWMNDSGFWVVNRLSGMTEKETLKSWTVLLTALSLMGLGITLILSWLLPMNGAF